MSDQLNTYLYIAAALLAFGVYGLLARRNAVAILIAIELILAAASLNFLAFNRFVLHDKGVGQVFAIFIIALAAAEACIALSIILMLSAKKNSVLIDDAKEMKG